MNNKLLRSNPINFFFLKKTKQKSTKTTDQYCNRLLLTQTNQESIRKFDKKKKKPRIKITIETFFLSFFFFESGEIFVTVGRAGGFVGALVGPAVRRVVRCADRALKPWTRGGRLGGAYSASISAHTRPQG